MFASLLKPFLKQMFIFQTETSSHKYTTIFSSFQIVSFDILSINTKLLPFLCSLSSIFWRIYRKLFGVLYIINYFLSNISTKS